MSSENSQLRAVIKKLERDVLSLEVDISVGGVADQPRSNSAQVARRRVFVRGENAKKHMLNPFLRAQNKLEVV